MQKLKILFLLISTCITSIYSQEVLKKESFINSIGKLKVSENCRFIIHENGEPFLYFGDTAWELFHRLTEQDIDRYFDNRVKKGFTVIQAVILPELDGINTADRNGNKPLLNNNPETPNELYFKWIDKIIHKAAMKGLYIGLLPTWGDKVDLQGGIGPVLFDEINAAIYGSFLGKRYKDYPNIIWINGGDRSGGGNNFKVWNALANAIKKEDPNHLMTYHPQGEASSSNWFHDCEWLDFNFCQTGHAQQTYEIYKRLLAHDYNLKPVKPCMDGEPRYEDLPYKFKEGNRRFDDVDVRQSLYWSLLSGAFGYTYGCNNIWQFYSKGRASMCYANRDWSESLDLSGVDCIVHAKKLLSSFDYLSRMPDQSIIITPQKNDSDFAVATRGKDFAFIYLPNGNPIEVSLSKILAKEVNLSWFNPRDGKFSNITNLRTNRTFYAKPAKNGRGNDWILIIQSIPRIKEEKMRYNDI